MKTKKAVRVIVAFFFTAMAIAGCSLLDKEKSNPVAPNEEMGLLNPTPAEIREAEVDVTETEEPSENKELPTLYSYPSYCFALNVPFMTQVPPGSWSRTKNCGQACGVMLGGYYNRGAVAAWVITAENRWLYNYTGDSRYLDPNGWYTGGSRLNAFRSMLWAFHRINTAVYHGNRADDVINEVANGRPTLVGVRIRGGRLVGSGGTPHWALAVGWDGNIILHDPGSTSGRYIRYSVSAFEDSWEEEGKIYMPTWKP